MVAPSWMLLRMLATSSLVMLSLVIASGCGGPSPAEPPPPTAQPEANPTAVAADPAASDPPTTPPADEQPAVEAEPPAADPEQNPVPAPDDPFPRRVPAPTLEGGLEWINTSEPLELQGLRGKFVLLDFWTYCCINCMHILPELKKLEHAYPNELVVIGVHSAKFEGEKDSENIRAAVLRYEIEHPVVNDAEHRIWDKFFVQSWPSLRVIDPEGHVIAMHSGEITFEELDQFFSKAVEHYREKGTLDLKPIAFDLERQRAERTPLRFPGKVLADEKSGRLFIADSNHNRIVITDLDGKLLDVIGSGTMGSDDGEYAAASFDHPQGMALKDQTLYVADTENHLLRKVDLEKKQVATIAGTGQQGRRAWPGIENVVVEPGGEPQNVPERWVGPPQETAIASPWALWVHEEDLYIAMAGPHQIWKMPLDESEIGPYAGNGREDIIDGPLLPKMPYEQGYSSFAQPSGLASDGTWLYVADSEGSSIRAVPFDATQEVKTVIGSAHLPSGRLFAFGDVDGQGDDVRLQHALGVVYYNELLYVADTYNDKIKVVDPVNRTSKTLAAADGSYGELDEPAGITAAAGKLYVADTNHHRICVFHLDEGNRVSTLEIEGLSPAEQPQARAPGNPPSEEAP